jgi:hypothetical protein
MTSSVTIYGREYEVKIGSRVRPENWAPYKSNQLIAGDSFSTFRMPTMSLGPITSLACEVELTGRTIQRVDGTYAIRCKIIFPGDGEPDTVTKGWMYID